MLCIIGFNVLSVILCMFFPRLINSVIVIWVLLIVMPAHAVMFVIGQILHVGLLIFGVPSAVFNYIWR